MRKPSRRSPSRWQRLVFAAGLLLALLTAGVALYAHSPYELPPEGRVVDVRPGGMRSVAQQLTEQGVGSAPWTLWLLARGSGLAASVQAGRYRIEPGATPWSLLRKLASGDSVKVAVTLVEGWRFSQWRTALDAEPALRHDSVGLSEAELMREVGSPGVAAEGRFLPDTYLVSYGTSDLVVLRMAHRAMQKALDEAWAGRSPDTPVKSAGEALVLASIVEKETAVAEERPMIAGVFCNRLRRGMLLQTDPSVIYGLGERFNGNITRADLARDTPWNTYTRPGLPPTPIAMPGRAALAAATRPARTEALYFVAAEAGRHVFSATLDEHNRAVRKLVRRTTP